MWALLLQLLQFDVILSFRGNWSIYWFFYFKHFITILLLIVIFAKGNSLFQFHQLRFWTHIRQQLFVVIRRRNFLDVFRVRCYTWSSTINNVRLFIFYLFFFCNVDSFHIQLHPTTTPTTTTTTTTTTNGITARFGP